MKHARAILAAALALLATLVLHVRDLGAPFFADDWLFLDATRSRSFVAALTGPDPIGNFARPLGRQAWFWAIDRLTVGSAAGFHAANLMLFVLALVLLGWLVRRVAGVRASVISVAILALTHAADVPLLWASGSQDLLALVLALGALIACDAGVAAGVPAALLLLLALFSKETVALTPFVATALVHRPEAGWGATARKVAPLFAAVLVWLVVVRTLPTGRALTSGAFVPDAAALFAALGGLVRTAAGAEHPPGLAQPLPLLALVAIALACASVWLASPAEAAPVRTRAFAGGLVWAIAGALPVMVVSGIWSAYFYLFAIAGFALLAGAALSRAPSWAAALVVAALGWGAQHASALRTFAPAPDAYGDVSHVNRWYVQEGARESDRLLGQLRVLHPSLPPRTTLFFSGLPAWIGFQAGNGPLVRTAWRDTSLRSYYLADLTSERAARGPWRILRYNLERRQLDDDTDDPMTLTSVALSMLLRDRTAVVDAAFEMAHARGQLTSSAAYAEAFRRWVKGDRDGAAAELRALGFTPRTGADAGVARARQAIAGRDTALARQLAERAAADYALDADAHSLLADLLLMAPDMRDAAVLEAYAALALAPDFPFSWRRWATVQMLFGHRSEAARSLDRYMELAPDAARTDLEAVELRARLATAPPDGMD